MIEVKGLTRKYSDLAAVDDVSFFIGKGDVVGLLGHNGADKTTIMRMLTGYVEPTERSMVTGLRGGGTSSTVLDDLDETSAWPTGLLR